MSKTVTAGVLLIGDELLSGRTQDKNLAALAKYLGPMGVQVREARMIPDMKDEIVAAVRAFSAKFDYVFTTGGIGPTHDDITADCMASAFGVGISERADAMAELLTRYEKNDLNTARRRMARIPDGASLIKNPVSAAPGFQIENVFVMAGVPAIMRGMLADIGHRIEGGLPMISRTVRGHYVVEGDAAAHLANIEAEHPGVSIGSYPFFTLKVHGANFVARSVDADMLDNVVQKLCDMVESFGQVPIVDPQTEPGLEGL